MKIRIWLIFLAAFFIRLIALNQSLWLDEGTTAKVVLHYRFTQIVSGFSPMDFHPPLYYLLMKFWTNVFGYSEVALRMPSVIFSLLTGYVIYKIVRLRQGFGESLWAAIFFLFNPLIVYYSQEARMYMMATFLLICSLYWLIKALQIQISPLRQGLFGLLISLSFATFYGSIFFIIPMLLLLIYKRKYKEFITSFLILNTCFLILSPLLFQQFSHSRESLIAVANWRSVLGMANLKNLLMIPLKFAFGRISFYPKWIYYGISGLWTIIVWFFTIKGGFKIKQLLYLVISPLIIGIFFSFFSPLLQYFRFLYLIPIMCILLAIGVSNRSEFNRLGWIMVTGFVILSSVYLFFPQFHREDWKSLALSLPKNATVYIIESSADALKYYRPDLIIKNLTSSDFMNDRTKNQNLTLIIIPYTTEIYGYGYKDKLKQSNFSNIKTYSFRQLTYEIWRGEGNF